MAEKNVLRKSKSFLQDYLEKYDLAHINEGYNEYWLNAAKQNYTSWNALVMDEFKFRESHESNLIWSTEGGQGSGKSRFNLRMCIISGQIFDKPFRLDNMYFFQQDLRNALKNFKKRTTYSEDEQPRTHGIMSKFLEDELADFEDLYRRPQVNISYVAPQLRTHNHFFVFKTLGDFFVYQKNQVAEVESMFLTKRNSDDMLMPRGIVRVKCPDQKIWDLYNKKKDQFLEAMKGKKGDRIKILEDYAIKVANKHFDKLYVKFKNGICKIKSKEILKLYLQKEFGVDSFTSGGLNQSVACLQEILLERLQKK